MLLFSTTAAGDAIAQPASMRFFGHGVGDIDRVKIPIDDPGSAVDPGPPVDVGATDFTIEFFLRAQASENTAGPISCSGTYDWIFGNIVLDRDRFNQGRSFGISIADARVVFGLNDEFQAATTLCGSTDVLDDAWHHVAVQRRRSDGLLWLYVDGVLEASEDGPDGDVSYPDDGVPGNFCGMTGSEPCLASDPFIVLGAEKHDAGAQFPSYSGLLAQLRFSNVLRYAGASFPVPTTPFVPDAQTVGLYRFDDAAPGPCTGSVGDASGAAGGPSDGSCAFGGAAPAGPLFSTEGPFPGAVPAASSALRALAGSLLVALGVRRLRPRKG